MKLKFRSKLSSKQLKQQAVESLKKELSEAKSLILFSSSMVTHKAFEELRQKLGETKARLRFVKNTLFKVAAQELKLPESLYSAEVITGSTSVIYVLSDDFISVVKALDIQFGKQEGVKVKIALLDKEIYNSSQVLEFAKIPSVLELQAKLVGLLNSPIQKLHYGLSYTMGKLVRSLSEIAKKGGE